ncbi:hypothetical protein [Ruegeria halocynthiae]|uniref:hypothetical protein n=1 Tax=Ruegeria halocynthiae TaxID=985054 RepID=UPI0012697012|nr:hypothetical protein [Ruegeria halocynthiae]
MNKLNLMMATALAASLVAGIAAAQEKVQIAFIDPLSGPFATTGAQGLAISSCISPTLPERGCLRASFSGCRRWGGVN